jgi:hypothetical protein
MYAVWFLAHAMSAPTVGAVKELERCLRYIRGTLDVKLCYTLSKNGDDDLDLSSVDYSPATITGFCDANHEPSYSASSCVVAFHNAALLWRVRKQESVSLSSVQSELTALSSMAQDMEMIRDLFGFLGIRLPAHASTVFCDSRGAIANAKHPNFSDKLRHVNNKIFFIREVVANGGVCVRWLPGLLNPADLGTKSLGPFLFRLYAGFVMNMHVAERTTRFAKWAARVPAMLAAAVV